MDRPVYPPVRRPRFDTGAPLPRRTPLRPDERRRANTLIGPPSGHAHIRARSLGSMPPEMAQNMLIGVEKIIRDFVALNSRTQTVAGEWGVHVGKIKALPGSAQPLTLDSPVGKEPSQFPNAEDYAYFSLLSIVNTHLYNRIFRPFHPAESDAENAKLETGYQRQAEIALQIGAAKWRAKRFQFIENSIDNARRASLLRSISDSIQKTWLDSLDSLPGSLDALPTAFIADMEAILGIAYEWHRVVKVEVAKYDFEPFAVQPLSPYDPTQMEPFERMRTQVVNGRPIVSCVSLGLLASAALEGQRVSHVQFKTKVLVEEWLSNPSSTSRLRTKSVSAAGPSRSRATAPPPTTQASAPIDPPAAGCKCVIL